MKILKKIITVLPAAFLLVVQTSPCCAQSQTYESVIKQRLSDIKAGLDTMLFVKRFESVETPCVCIDEKNNAMADPKRKIINSNYRVGLIKNRIDSGVGLKKNRIDSGVECLSQYYARYAAFTVTNCDTVNQRLTGNMQFTYGYPASSIIQYLGFTWTGPDKSKAFFERLLRSSGTFSLYPENDKYRIQIALTDGPYDKNDTVYGYLEIIKGAYKCNPPTAYTIYFDKLSISTGDTNNQIFLKFSTTSFDYEAEYYTVLMYDVLKYINKAADQEKYANAIWLKSFFDNPKCPQCRFIYTQAAHMVSGHVFSLPNTEPLPSH